MGLGEYPVMWDEEILQQLLNQDYILENLFRQRTSQQELLFPAKLTRSLGGREKLSVSALDGEKFKIWSWGPLVGS